MFLGVTIFITDLVNDSRDSIVQSLRTPKNKISSSQIIVLESISCCGRLAIRLLIRGFVFITFICFSQS